MPAWKPQNSCPPCRRCNVMRAPRVLARHDFMMCCRCFILTHALKPVHEPQHGVEVRHLAARAEAANAEQNEAQLEQPLAA